MNDDDPTRATENAGHRADVLARGLTLGKFRIDAVLGQGGFGITYRATDTKLGRSVAIKEFMPSGMVSRVDGTTLKVRSLRDSEDFAWGLERFLNEARLLARFDKVPGIVRVFDYFEANATAYMVMDLVAGETLKTLYDRQGTVAESVLKPLALTLLDGLEQIHNAGYLHRDVKPANIIVTPQGAPVLIDFGAAREAFSAKSRQWTNILTPVYSLGFSPPEQTTEGKWQGPWTDIYACAATLYHGVTGQLPHNASERLSYDAMIPAAQAARADFSERFLAAIDRGLALDERLRPQTVGDWRKMMA